MKIVNRRLFLQGASSVLALPMLRSLMPASAWADAATDKPVRYVQVMSPYGPSQALFYGAMKPNQRVSPHFNIAPLANFATMSPMLGAGFNPYKSKMTVLRGMDVFGVNANHQFCFATCASTYAAGVDRDEQPPVTGQQSIDAILAASSKVYGADVPAARRQLNLNPTTTDSYSNNRTWSWSTINNKLQMLRPVKQTQALYDALAAGFEGSKVVDPKEQSLLQAVNADYRQVRDSSRISREDRMKLESYVALVSDIEKGLTATLPKCTSPMRVEEADVEKTIDNQFRILAAAMACDLTRVAGITLGMSEGYGTRHSEHHGILGNPPGIVADYKLIGARVARLLKIFDDTKEASGGTLLDNSIIYWSTQYGLATLGGQHSASDMPVVVAGGARGQLKHGNYLDFREEIGGTVTEFTRKGIALSNFLVTLFNCMGLSSADYESVTGQGYGYMDSAKVWANRKNVGSWDSEAGRRSPLPMLYTGISRG